MKNVILALLIVFAAQPVQASACAMGMNTGEMNSGMDHVMHHAPQAPQSDTDCCDQDETLTSQPCDPTAHCSATPAGAAALDASFIAGTVFINGSLPSFENGPLTPSFDSPPYRPPIS